MISASPKGFKQAVIKYCRSEFANLGATWATTRTQRDIQQVWTCSTCGACFKAKQALAVHSYRKHCQKRVERLYLDSTHCTVCLVEFWSRERVIAHISEKSHVCRHNLVLRGPVLTQDQADELDREELQEQIRANRSCGLRRSHAHKPCVRLQGPLPNVIPLCDVAGEHHPLGIGHKWHS